MGGGGTQTFLILGDLVAGLSAASLQATAAQTEFAVTATARPCDYGARLELKYAKSLDYTLPEMGKGHHAPSCLGRNLASPCWKTACSGPVLLSHVM